MTFVTVPWLIRNLQGTSAMGRDLNKREAPLVPEMGGLAVVIGFYVGVSLLTLLGDDTFPSEYLYASLLAVLGAAVVGMMDDLFDLRQRVKAILPFAFAIPLGGLVFASGDTILLSLDIGILMLLAVPVGVTCAANAANMLEGFNGLGAGLGIIMTVTMIIVSHIHGASEGLFLLYPLLGGLVAFLWFNRYPARIFPGDSMTLFVGATLAAAVIISAPSLKLLGALMFAPMIVEFILKARGRFAGENYGSPDEDGVLHYSGRTESMAHMLMKRRRLTEPQLVHVFWGVEAAVCLAVIVLSMA